MPIKRKYSNNKKNCKVTFTVAKEISDQFKTISLVGDFNLWDPKENIFLETEKDGVYSASIILGTNSNYQFRYLGDGAYWFNEPDADKEEETYFPGARNSVVVV